ncbi:nucleoid-associated protein, YbaB/EbfC family [Candidatus Peregrinibacteria bacterium CG10_big_fil_rev_8_21_14_0_10_36_19]|nr:MAG: nucleoid-associated protein, YbaB/EbfC family [Candidatus Peregrinibacteria bacterium CG10_big_fil_rev_8_21_14_0_10_36_19]
MFDQAKDLYKLQKQAKEIKKKLENTHIEAEENGVIITINGEQKVLKVTIQDEMLQNKTQLEANLEKAFNKGVKKAQEIGASMMKDIMGDFNLPGMN